MFSFFSPGALIPFGAKKYRRKKESHQDSLAEFQMSGEKR
jgi:hypothetical protein